MSTETTWTHPDNMTLGDFQSAGLAVPGMLVELHDERGTTTALIGHMNDLLGLCDDCSEDGGAQVVRYRRVWSPDVPAPAPSVVPEAAVEAAVALSGPSATREGDGSCSITAPHGPHRWDTEDRLHLRRECPGTITPKEDR